LAPTVPIVNASVELPVAGSTLVALNESPSSVTCGGILIGNCSSKVPA